MNRLYGLKKKIIAITGGIATGKSTFSNLLEEKGFTVICADKLVKKIYAKQESIDFIASISKEFIKEDLINFKKLREAFFKDQKIKNSVENYLYPQLENNFLEESKNMTSPIIYDVPLLFEKNLQGNVDKIALVYANKNQQIERLCTRDKITRELASNILDHQMSIDLKKSLSDIVIDNSKNQKELESEFQSKFIPLFKSLEH